MKKKKIKNYFFLITLSIIFIIIDNEFRLSRYLKIYLENQNNNFYYLKTKLKKNIELLKLNFIENKDLKLKNKVLYEELFLKKLDLLKLDFLKKENYYLKKIINDKFLLHKKKIIAQVLSIGKKSYNDQIIINKGSQDGVHEGQILINDKGIIGQIISINKYTSRAILICNINHALPVQTLRNSIKIIALGNGCKKNMQLDFISNLDEIKIGDILITSGLGGRFLPGYPVGFVKSIIYDNSKDISFIEVHSMVNFNELNYLALLE